MNHRHQLAENGLSCVHPSSIKGSQSSGQK
jgi:hypothetical protein